MRYNYLNFLTKQLGNSQEINFKSNEIVSFYTVKPKCSIKNIYKKNIPDRCVSVFEICPKKVPNNSTLQCTK